MAETTNREAAETCLQAVSMAGHKAADDFGPTSPEAVTCVAYAGIIAALLDVADAVREQGRETAAGLEELKKSVDYLGEHRKGVPY